MTYIDDVNGMDRCRGLRMRSKDVWIGSSANVWSHDATNGHCAILSITNYSVNTYLPIDATSSSAATVSTNLCTLIKKLVDLGILNEGHLGSV